MWEQLPAILFTPSPLTGRSGSPGREQVRVLGIHMPVEIVTQQCCPKGSHHRTNTRGNITNELAEDTVARTENHVLTRSGVHWHCSFIALVQASGLVAV